MDDLLKLHLEKERRRSSGDEFGQPRRTRQGRDP